MKKKKRISMFWNVAIGLVILLAICFFLFSTRVKAETNVTVDVFTDQNQNVFSTQMWVSDNSNANLWVNYNQDVNNINTVGVATASDLNGKLSPGDLQWYLEEMKTWFYMGVLGIYENQTTHSIPQLSKNIFALLNDVFVNRQDGNVINQKLDYLNLRISALEKTIEQMDSKKYCQGRLDVMYEYNLKSISCGNVTYFPDMNGYTVGIEEI